MGKGILVFVMLTSLAGTAMYATQSERQLEQTASETEYKSEVLAREAAVSAYNLLVGKVKRDFDGYRVNTTDMEFGKSKFDMSATDAQDGSVTVVAVGKYGDREYEIVGSVSKTGSSVLDAVTIVTNVTSVELEDDFSISGGTTHAVKVLWSATREAFLSQNNGDQISGIGGDADIEHQELEINLGSLRSKIQSYTGSNLVLPILKGKDDFSDWLKDQGKNGIQNPAGAPGSPVILRLSDKTVLEKDFVGYGVLFVEDDLTLEDGASWNGLVYLAGEGSKFKMTDNSSINGSLIYDATDTLVIDDQPNSDEGLPGGHFDVDIFDEPMSSREIYHQHAYDDKYGVTVDLLNAGCKNGKLCWNEVMGGLGLSEVEIVNSNTNNVQGTYQIRVGSTVYSGDTSVPFVIKAKPSDISKMSFTITSLCSLNPSSPSNAQDRFNGRGGSFGILVKDTSAKKFISGSTANDDSNSGLVYEMSIYHHAKKGETCVSGSPVVVEDLMWSNPKGDVYGGEDAACVSEDLNDYLYTDAKQRSKKWGTRKYQASKPGKKSEKFWLPSGECGVAEVTKTNKGVIFSMSDNASIVYNLPVLKNLKSMLSEMDVESGAPVARRLSGTSKLRNVVIQMDGTTSPK